jgi:hypothetical protein
MSAATSTPTTAQAGEQVELGRYRTAHGERVLIGQRVRGIVRVSDIPAIGRGRRYLVERELTSKVELDAHVVDYLAQARIRATCPMGTHAELAESSR